MHLALAILVRVFGAATLILHDVRFLQWKASVFYWLIGVVFGGSVWIGKKTLLERMIGAALPEASRCRRASWRNAVAAHAAFFTWRSVREHLGRLTPQRSRPGCHFKVWIAVPLAMSSSLGVVLYLLRGVFKKERRNPP